MLWIQLSSDFSFRAAFNILRKVMFLWLGLCPLFSLLLNPNFLSHNVLHFKKDWSIVVTKAHYVLSCSICEQKFFFMSCTAPPLLTFSSRKLWLSQRLYVGFFPSYQPYTADGFSSAVHELPDV